MEDRLERHHPEMEAMHRRFRTQPCFVCKLAAGERTVPRNVFYEDDGAIVFLDGYPRAYGYSLVGAKRMHLYTVGSNEGNAHVHWHIVPLPPGVPYDKQQGAWASWSSGVLEIPQEEMASLAARIGSRLG
jgi:diadenosine tetraphosphate (Ap4A) HIT family hydrolase